MKRHSTRYEARFTRFDRYPGRDRGGTFPSKQSINVLSHVQKKSNSIHYISYYLL